MVVTNMWESESMKSFSDEDERVRLKEHALRYADGTSIHGIKYTCEPGRTLLEKFLWICWCLTSFILCIYLIIPIYTKWRQDPTFTTIKSTDYPVWNVHFPAVTLCSNIRVERKRLERALNTTQWQKILHKYHLETKKAAQDMMPLLDKVVNYIDLESGRFLGLNTSKPVQQIFEDNSDLVEELLKETMPSCNQIIIDCRWHGKVVECPKFFSVQRTDNGFCCSFNVIRQEALFGEAPSVAGNEFDEYDYYDYNEGSGSDEGESEYYFYYDDWGSGNFMEEDTNYSTSGSGDGSATTTDPNATTEDPNATTEDSNAATEDSNATTEDPNVTTKDPNATTEDPNATTKDPNATTEDPNATTEDPNVTTEDPNGTTEDPNATTEDPNSTTKDPNATTEDPNATTEDPNVTTEDPNGTTEDPIGDDVSGVRRRRSVSMNSKSRMRKLRKTNSASSRLGLTLILDPDLGAYAPNKSIMTNNYRGFKALIHGPYEYAEVMNKGFAIGTGEEIFVGLSAVITESNAAVKEMNIDRRKCVKSDEDPAVLKAHNIELRVYQYYEKMSCLMECRAREILKSCNCLPYHYPKFGQFLNRSTACNLKGLFCLNTIINDMYAVSPDTEALSGGPDFVDGPKCNCPNACDGTQYLAEISKVELEPQSPYINQVEKRKGSTLNRRLIRTQKLQDIYLKLKNNSKMAEPWERHHQVQENYNLVHIYFKNLGAVYYTREQLYGIMDLIGAMGGIIGLCMGFSLLSGVEFLYFFTLRLWIDQDRARRKMKGKK